MRLGEIEGDGDPLARLERDRVEHARNPVAAAEGDEDERLVAKGLGHGNGKLALDDLAARGGGQAVPARVDIVRPHAEGDMPIGKCGVLESVRNRQPVAAGKDDSPVVDCRVNEVHGRRADEAGDESGLRASEHVIGRTDLFDQPVAHDDDAVGERHRLDLVVGDIDDGRRHARVQELDLGAHLRAELRVEVRKRLVEQEHLGLAHDRPSHRHSLPLAAGKLGGLAVEEIAEMKDLGGLGHARLDLRLRTLGDLEGEGHVLSNAHMRIERVGLEHHRNVPRARREIVDDLAADPDRSRRNLLEPRDHSERRRFPAARRADKGDELALRNSKIDRPHRFDRTVALDQPFERHRRHRQPFTAPKVSPDTRRF